MNWKERFKWHFYNSEINNEYGWLAEMMNGGDSGKEILDFISTEIIEELIEDIPEYLEGHAGHYKRTSQQMLGTRQQLRDKWL